MNKHKQNQSDESREQADGCRGLGKMGEGE